MQGKSVQYDPFETFNDVHTSTRETWILRTVFFLEHVYDLRYSTMLTHARLHNIPTTPKPPTFLMGGLGQVHIIGQFVIQ